MRLPSWDYRNPGYYFITINTKYRVQNLCRIDKNSVTTFIPGMIAENELLKTGIINHNVSIDEYVIMPDHVHFILEIAFDLQNNPLEYRSVARYASAKKYIAHGRNHEISHSRISPMPGSVSALVRAYKSAVTRVCHDSGIPDFAWQPRFYDRIIRDRHELRGTRKYIRNNVEKWRMKYL